MSEHIRDMIERSSLGTPEAKAARASVSDEEVQRVLARTAELRAERAPIEARLHAADGALDLLRGSGMDSVDDLIALADWLHTGCARVAMQMADQRAIHYAVRSDSPDAASWSP